MIRIAIREVVDGDAAAVARLSEQLGYPMGPATARERFAALAHGGRDAIFVAANDDGQVIGWVHVFGAQYLVTEAHAEVGGLIVDEAFRGQGIGRALLARAESWARDHAYARLRVRSNTVRTRAHEFYRRHGYELRKTQGVFELMLDSNAAR
jgi:GNAT superfamily N-acetyltransferase